MFHHTDKLITAAVECGAEIIYRFGESIDHTIYKRFARPPKDFEKFARICVQIIRHYNMGWANGFNYGIEYLHTIRIALVTTFKLHYFTCHQI